MIFNDEWTEGLTPQQQKCVIDYVMDGCQTIKGQGGYKSISTINNFVNSEKGRTAIRKYCDFFFDLKKDTIRVRLLKVYLKRAFFNPADILTAKGELIVDDLKDLGDLAYCVEGIEREDKGITLVPSAKNGFEKMSKIKIKLCDRDKAVDFIARLFKIFDDDFEADITDEKNVWQMTDEERDEEIKRLIEKTGFLPAPEKKEKK